MNNKKTINKFLRKVFSREIVFFTFVYALSFRLAEYIDSNGTFFHYIILFFVLGYVFSLTLAKSLDEYFNVGDIPIISVNPKIGTKPIVLSLWILLFQALIILMSFTCWFILSSALNSMVITSDIWLVATTLLYLIGLGLISPFLMSRAFCGDETKSDIAKKFRRQFDKRGYIFYFVGILIHVIVLFTIPETPLKIYMAQGNVVDLTQARTFLLTFLSYWIFIMCTCAGLIYAYSSWLSKADLKEVGEYFNLPLKEEDELKAMDDNLG